MTTLNDNPSSDPHSIQGGTPRRHAGRDEAGDPGTTATLGAWRPRDAGLAKRPDEAGDPATTGGRGTQGRRGGLFLTDARLAAVLGPRKSRGRRGPPCWQERGPGCWEPMPPITIDELDHVLASYGGGAGLGWDCLHPKQLRGPPRARIPLGRFREDDGGAETASGGDNSGSLGAGGPGACTGRGGRSGAPRDAPRAPWKRSGAIYP